jgi:hypothetical protein
VQPHATGSAGHILLWNAAAGVDTSTTLSFV